MIKIIGQETGKIYAEGYRPDCFRELSIKYPTNKKDSHFIKHGKNVDRIYPEPLVVVKK